MSENTKLREQFELWAKKRLPYHTSVIIRDGDTYADPLLDDCWQASQEAHKLALAVKPTAWYVKATGAFHLNYERITSNEFLLGVTELREIV